MIFDYYLLYRPVGAAPGDLEDHPLRAGEVPVNVIAVARTGGPTQAVIWDRRPARWAFRPDVALAILWAHPERHRFRITDRAEAADAAPHFSPVPLPGEAELARICGAASND